MVISSPDILLQEEIRYFPSKAQGGKTRQLYADHSIRILLHAQRKQLSASEKNKAHLPEWLMSVSWWCSHNYFNHSSHSLSKQTARCFEKDEK